MKKILVLFVFLLLATSVYAQISTVSWTQTEAPAIANGFTYTLKVDALAAVNITPTCVAQGTGSSCSGTFTLANPTATHGYVFTATNAYGSAVATLSPGAPPNTSGFKIVITVTITPSDEN